MIKSLAMCAVIAVAMPAFAQDAPPRAVFDATGWTLLGSQTAKGGNDHDTITVGRYEGKFDQVTMVVTEGDVAIKDLSFVFGNGEKWSPSLKHVFREGARSRVIDLPGNTRTIAKIDILYASPPGQKARVWFYGHEKGASAGGGGAPRPPVFDARGWQLLGSQSVDGHRDRDTINVGRYDGKFDQLTMVVSDSDLELKEFSVTFGNGEKWEPKLPHFFREGQRTHVIDLPGNNRVIAKIDLRYANTPGGGKARVEVYGRDKHRPGPGPTPTPPPAFDPTGWTLLGSGVVNGARDRDTIRVGKYKGGFDQLTMVVSDSDLDLADMTIVFSGGERWTPHLKHTFREGQRSRVIDLPGKDRFITRVELAYANLPGGGKARVELYGRDVGRPAPPPFTPVQWENKGWTFLGKRTVDGWHDRDRLKVSTGKPFSQLMFVVTGSDVQLTNILVTLGNGEKFEMKNPVVFKEGTRTSPIDIPGKLRQVRTVDFAYSNIAGGGRASIEVWGRASATQPAAPPPQPPAPPPPPPPPAPDVRDHRR